MRIKIGERAACAKCGQDIEWNGSAWWDRGAGTDCLPYRNRDGETVTPHGKHKR